MAVSIVGIVYFVFSPVQFIFGAGIDKQYGTLSLDGLSVGAFDARVFILFSLAVVFILCFTALLYIAALQKDEFDTGEYQY